MSIEKSNNSSTELQALYMADFAGIELTPGQIAQYVQYRHGIFDHKTPEGPSLLFNQSDQKILDMVLTPEQRLTFRSHSPKIFQHGIKSEE